MSTTGTPKNFVDLQAAFYNALAQALGFSPSDPFQVVQPSPPLVGGSDANQLLWNYYNNIPPYSLTQNTILSGGNQFLADYQGVMSALQAGPNMFKDTIGEQCYEQFNAAMEAGTVSYDPTAFRNWAFANGWAKVAVSGASALAVTLLDPILAAQMNTLPYKPVGRKSVDFTPGYKTMMKLLDAAPSRSIPLIGTNQWNWDVSRSWTSGQDQGFFGLWRGSSSTSSISQKFASSGVSLSASFGNVLQLPATPGDWYSSAALGMAYNNPGSAPWNPDSPITWEKTFGKSGNMQRFLSNLVIVQDMLVTVTSVASYSEQEQQEIRSNSSAGLWPFYAQSSSGGSSTDVGFNASGQMTVVITSKPKVAVVVGCTVLPASVYLGHEGERSRLLVAARAARAAR